MRLASEPGVPTTGGGVGTPSDYLALVAQDLDGMGAFLCGEGAARDGRAIAVSAAEHQRISAMLRKLGEDQVKALGTAKVQGAGIW